jgi:uncharacterized membrane protein YfcA
VGFPVLMSVLAEAGVLAGAGVVAGAVGSAGGITSLVSFSALLAVGVPTRVADVANLVAVVACWPGSALTSRRELAGTGGSLAWGLPVAAGGAAAGAVLLLATPAGVFSRVVPFLVLLGAAALLAQPWLTARFPRQGHHEVLAWPLVGLVAIYLGYFGAGSGVLVLAVMLVLIDDRLPEANAVKNMLVGAGSAASAVVFISAGPIDWSVIWPLALGLFGGGALGPLVARRLPASIVRWSVAALACALAIELWLRGP